MKILTGLICCSVVAVSSTQPALVTQQEVVVDPQTKLLLPHIVFVLVDDFGWAEVGYHRDNDTEAKKEVLTPTIDNLVAEGVELNRHYVHMMCTPTRASLQSGRLPIHVLTSLADPCDENGAIPRNMTGLAAQLKKAGYATHHVGKWDAGMVTPHHTPQGRGYDTSLNYFGHGNWMYSNFEWGGSQNERNSIPTEINDGLFTDFWDTDKPAVELARQQYEEYTFRTRFLDIINNHNTSTPLLLMYHSKLCHYPLQAPPEYQNMFSFIEDDNRRMYHAMVHFLDDQLKVLTNAMKTRGMWENTLFVLSSDNGGYVKSENGGCNTTTGTAGVNSSDVGHGTVCFNGEAGANNFPLRGGKYSMFEGGIRVNAFASGGFLPQNVRGTKLQGTIAVADWYGTFCGLANVDPTDSWAAQSDLPPIDSVDVWPMLSGTNLTSPRDNIGILYGAKGPLVMGDWKYVAGGVKMIESGYGGEQYPNTSSAQENRYVDGEHIVCPADGCLFNVVLDPSEENEISSQHPDVVKRLNSVLEEQAKTIWSTSHQQDPACHKYANEHYNGFYGPWKEV
jgi:arylsulfatase I/J